MALKRELKRAIKREGAQERELKIERTNEGGAMRHAL